MKKPNSKEHHDLSIEISFLEGLRNRMPQDSEVLKVLGDNYTKARRLQDGLSIDLELAQLIPDDPVVHYNLACSLSLLGKLSESANALKKAVQLGYREWDWMMKDQDLENLRKSPEFSDIVSIMNKFSKRVE
jgi:hypothetical protein